jgi:hypothetical protein
MNLSLSERVINKHRPELTMAHLGIGKQALEAMPASCRIGWQDVSAPREKRPSGKITEAEARK